MMNDQPSTATPLTLSTVTIETADSQGHSVPLAAPIQVSGQFDASAFFDQYPPSQQLVATPTALEIGVDEAGRGPLLGSVTVAAAILPKAWSGLIEERLLRDTPLSILTDSKQLSEKKRDRLYPLVQTHALGYVIADVPAAIIDQINILQATQLGMRLCAEALIKAVAAHCASAEALLPDSVKRPQFTVLFDGNRCPEIHFSQLASFGVMQADVECQAWIKGDARHTSIAAASVLAKVSRDQTMYALAEQYPNYGIAKHKGYPTRAHLAAIAAHGVLPEHRRSFAPIKEALKS